MSAFEVVLDACVLFPASIRDTLLRAADAGLYRVYWSELILEEVRRNLIGQRRATAQQADRLLAVMSDQFPEASVTGYEPLIDGMTNDPKDRHVVAAAVVAGAQVIVTSNLRDFPQQALERFSIEAQSPDEFLTNLLDLAPERVTRLIAEQATDLRAPPMTVNQILDEIAVHAPQFSAAVRQRIGGGPARPSPRPQ